MLSCSSCLAGCCRRFDVPLTGFDIIKIQKALNLEYYEIAQLIPVKEDSYEKNSKATGVFKFNNFDAGEYFTFYLRNIKSKYIPDSYKCMFLQEWNGEDFLLHDRPGIKARCGIYNIRPLICSVYPARLHENELIGVVKNPTKHLEKPDNPAYNLCPEEYDEKEFFTDSDEIIKNLVLYKYEVNYFQFLAEVWNQNTCDFGLFYNFLEESYKNRILIDQTPNNSLSEESSQMYGD